MTTSFPTRPSSDLTGRYKGNPMMMHLKHRARITPELFDRWLALWAETTDELMPPDIAAALQAKAGRISESLQLGMFFRLDPHPSGAIDRKSTRLNSSH